MKDKDLSRFLSLVLRHKPEEIGITLDAQGWVAVDTLLQALNDRKHPIDRAKLEQIVAENNKKRFAFDETGTLIRANQGHSIEVDLALPASEPPATLYHGTATQNIEAIRKEGLQKQSRQHVHLSTNKDTATQVGGRHGKPVILVVRAGEMHQAGFAFYISENGVWLTDHVPTAYIDFPTPL
ncbi:MAG: RNA 2'-phosphotransferase [Bacteroidetes bacterium]|nr:MAG: RNA 2'-phosphotransferase [Bacteroidota bacterium]